MPNTNITNLLGNSLKYKKNNKPKGYEIFTNSLGELNLPEELIRNPERLKLLETYGYEKTPGRGKGRKSVQKDQSLLPRARKDLSDYSVRLTFKKALVTVNI